MKLKQLVESTTALNKLVDQKLPIKVSFQLSTFLSKTNPELTNFDKLRTEKIQEYGERVIKDGKPTEEYTIPKDKVEEWSKEINELLEQEIDVKIPDIKIDDLGDINIEPTSLMGLEWLIK